MEQPNKRNQNTPSQVPAGSNHIKPQATDVEKAVLGALMIDKDAYAIICDILHPESFYEPRNQLVYAAIQDLGDSDNKKPIDILTVTEQLAKNGTLSDIGGPGYVTELTSRVASSANIEYHALIVAQKWATRQFIDVCYKSSEKGYDETTEIEDLLDETEAGLAQVRDTFPLKVEKTAQVFAKQAIDEIEEAAARPDGLSGIASFPSLDAITNGWQNSDLVIIAGRPSEGKTAFALNAATIISIFNNIPTAIFSLEMSGSQLMKRIISSTCQIDNKGLVSGQLLPDEWDRIDKNLSFFLDAPLYIDDAKGLTLQQFRSKARSLVKKGVKIIFIDYLQLMHYNGKRFSNRQEEVSEISRGLKAIAGDLNIPIIALSQLNRGVENREGLDGKRPRLSDLRESGAIEQDADIVIFVYRPERHGILQDDRGRSLIGTAKIIIDKHRKGSLGEFEMKFTPNYTLFEEISDLGSHPERKDNSTEKSEEADFNNGEPSPF